jgi:prepilin-type N-terminal cleavage/methylation domain-containing protein
MTREAARRLATGGGYTLIELLVGISIFSIVALVGLPHVDTRREGINMAVQHLIADLRLARARAITSGTRHAIAFTGSHAYELQRLAMNAAGTWELDQVVKTVQLADGIKAFVPDTPDERVEFNTRGMMISSPQPLLPVLADEHHQVERRLAVWPSGQIYQED